MRSVYIFHVYFQTRRVLAELHAALPNEATWNAYENTYDCKSYERLCSEFDVSPNTDWKRKGLPNYGLGKVYTNGHPIGDGWYYPNFTYGWRGSGTNWTQDAHAQGMIKESFTEGTGSSGRGFTLHADYISQDDPNTGTMWTSFILDESQGFTQAGVVRLNDCIRTCVYTILGAQAQTITRILGTGTAFDAQKQFLALLEAAINDPTDLPSGIQRYQDMLQKASSKLDYVFGIGLYLAPSDMRLNIGQIQGYNNEIVIATPDMALGSNTYVNSAPVPERGPMPAHYEPPPYVPTMPVATTIAADVAAANQHADEKTVLVIAAVAIGLVFLWFRR